MNAAAEKAEAAKMGFHIANGQITAKKILQRDVIGPLAGARAEVVHGADSSRFTATRIAAFGPFGLLMKKNTTAVFVIVSCANGVEIVSEIERKQEADARRWAGRFNSKRATEQ